MPETIDLFVPLDEIDGPLASRVEQALGWGRGQAGELRVLRRSLDARKGRPLGQRLRVLVGRKGEALAPAGAAGGPLPTHRRPHWPAGRPPPRVVVVGSGPAGSWAALRLAEAGVPVTIVEQGKPVQPRRRDLALLTRGELTPSSNYCFGEGGAGTYSRRQALHARQGSRRRRRRDRDLVRFGAPDDIVVDARPHIGSNRLPRVLTTLRAHLERAGRRVPVRDGDRRSARARRTRARACVAGGDEIAADAVVLAIGHSARATCTRWAAAAGLALERKPFAVGVRIEHPQRLIDRSSTARRPVTPSCRRRSIELTAAVGRPRRLQLLHVPGRLDRAGGDRAGRRRRQRHEPVAPRLAVRELRRGRLRRRRATSVPRRTGRWPASSCSGGSSGRRFASAAATSAPPRSGWSTSSPAARAARCRSSYRPGLAPADLRTVLPPFVADALRAGLRGMGARMPGLSVRGRRAGRRRDAHERAGPHRCATRDAGLAVDGRRLPVRRRRGLRRRHRQRRARRRARRRADSRVSVSLKEPGRPARSAPGAARPSARR